MSANSNIPARFVVPLSELQEDDPEEAQMLLSMASDAKSYLSAFEWCQSIKGVYFGAGIGRVIAIFLLKIVPSSDEVEDWLWVVVGDLPSAYLVTDQGKTPAQALELYIDEMRRWTRLARLGQASVDVIPVNAPAMPEWAEKLDSRLSFLENRVLRNFKESESE